MGVDPSSFEGSNGPGRPGGPSRPVIARRRRGALLPTLAILAALVILLLIGANFWTDLLWYQSVGYTKVFTTELVAKVLLFVVGGLLAGGAVFSSLIIAFRTRPVYAPVSPEQASLDRYREQIEPLRKIGTIAIPVVVGLLSGGAAAGEWKTYLLWRHGQPFHIKDPQFHLDVGFFVFTLPWLRFVAGFLMTIIIVAGIAAAATHYLYGGLRVQGGSGRTTTAARVHLSVILGLLVLLRAGNYWLERYELATKNSTLITGLTYADAHALLPAKAILAAASVICAVLFFATIWTGSWRLPGVGVVLLLVCAIVIGLIYPALVQSLKVRPSAQTLERPYISRNIAATRSAYDLTGVQSTAYNAQTTATSGQLRNDAETIPGIRLLDPSRVSDTFRQLEQIRQYYAFPDSLDVDRYTINGKSADTVIAVRELNLAGISGAQRNWLNDHTTYTHGFGVVAAYGNQRTSDGRPVFFEGDIPPTGALSITQPRIYFGEQSPDYSIVGHRPVLRRASSTTRTAARPVSRTTPTPATAASRSARSPSDWPTRSSTRTRTSCCPTRSTRTARSSTTASPRERIEKVAPWLTLDGDPYPAVVDGHIEWIVDGYTTSDDYPYSRLTTLNSATQDSLTATTNSVVALGQQDVNYIRNSVKATVDAYTGKVTLYAWDQGDPMLKAWERAFPGIGQAALGHQRRSDGAPALPGGPVQGAARHAREVPRDRPGVVLRRPGLLDHPAGPDADRRQHAAAVLPDAEDADAGRSVVLADVDLHPGRLRDPIGADGVPGRRCRRRKHRRDGESGLRHDTNARAAQGHRDIRARAGAEPVQQQPDGAEPAAVAEPERFQGRVRQPADLAGRRRPALRATGLRAGHRRDVVPVVAGRLRRLR